MEGIFQLVKVTSTRWKLLTNMFFIDPIIATFFFFNVTIMATFYIGEGFANRLFSYTIYYYLVTLPPNTMNFFQRSWHSSKGVLWNSWKLLHYTKGMLFLLSTLLLVYHCYISLHCCLLGVDPNDCSMPWMTQHLYWYHHKNLKPIFIYYSFKWDKKIGHSHMIIFIHFIFHPNFLTRKHYTCRFAY
jgi:hypothetical protein